MLLIKIVIWFQFHKVRLKDDARATLENFMKFQFHKVRLKGIILLLLFLGLNGFNSTRYD